MAKVWQGGTITTSSRPRRVPDYWLEQIDDELLLFHPAQTTVLYCNETATLIWQLCDGTHTGLEIITILMEAYPEARGAIPGDVDATLQQLFKHGAIEYI